MKNNFKLGYMVVILYFNFVLVMFGEIMEMILFLVWKELKFVRELNMWVFYIYGVWNINISIR